MRTLTALLLFSLAGLACAQERIIVDRAYVQDAAKRNVLILDARNSVEYKKGHLPGAISIGDLAQVLRNDNTEDFLANERIEKILGTAGIDPTHEIIIYGQRGTWNPYFGQYTMQYFGGTQARVYHDGIEDWISAGLPVSREEMKRAPIALKLKPNPEASVSTRDVIARLNRNDVQIVDARTPREFAGEDIRAIRGGHIPGAVNIPYEQNWVDPATPQKLARREVSDTLGMSLKSVEQLKALYSGLDPSKETIVYCQSGARASETAGVLQQLGFSKVKVYDSSWLGYGNTLDAPANNATFFNVGLLNGRIASMQNRIDFLEREVAETKAGRK